MTAAESPRIYVASLSDYNAGHLHGVWIDATLDADSVHEQIDRMLAASHEEVAEEYAIHDYENFGPLQLSEYEPLDQVLKLATGIVRHGDAYAAWASYLGSGNWGDLDQFEDAYQGTWDSLREYAEDLLDGCGVSPDPADWAPGLIANYVDFDLGAFARDLDGGYVIVERSDDGKVHVFEP